MGRAVTAMQLHLDRETCIGSGNCARVADAIFDQDDDGRVMLRDHADPGAHADDVTLAVDNCPVGALWFGP